MEFGQLMTLLSLSVAALALLFGRTDRGQDSAQKLQRISTTVDDIKDDVRETKGDVKDMNRMLADHSERLKLMEERQTSMGERIVRLEKRCDMRNVGGTD